jgi:hypothetical protein
MSETTRNAVRLNTDNGNITYDTKTRNNDDIRDGHSKREALALKGAFCINRRRHLRFGQSDAYTICNEADAKGIREFARRLEAGKEGGDTVNRKEKTRIRTLTGPVARDRRRSRVGAGEMQPRSKVKTS